MFNHTVSAPSKAFPAILLCFFGVMIAALSFQYYQNKRSAHLLHEFSTRYASGLVPVDCKEAYGKRDVDFIGAYGKAAFYRGPKKPTYLYACWYPIPRYVQIFRIEGDPVESVRRQYELLEFEQFELKPTELSYWPLTGIPIGIFIFFVGLSVPFIRAKPNADKEGMSDIVEIDISVLKSDLTRLRERLKS